MSAQHTPGPWSFDGPPDNHIVWSDSENRVCFLAHSNGANEARDTANARLIAAAPELLGALTNLRNILNAAGYETSHANAAIAKATGAA